MKTIFLFALLATLPFALLAQKKAVTETGEEVILNEDGTWQYLEGEEPEKEIIPTNEKAFTKNSNASFLVKSNKFNVGVWLNSKKWTFEKATTNEYAEYEFRNKANDLYAMTIVEKMSVPLTTLAELALSNARKVAPDLKVTKKEYRKVNGLEVLMMEMSGTVKGIKVAYMGYYYTNEHGTLQFLTFGSQEQMKNHKSECEDFLNGLVELSK
jgi:hypothetical protein